ncbi:MAG: ABC-three component system protein [Pseudomonas sp.]|uniref:ABC-three component system protein n=1 Tax=Pseudomonas sp. TaxID=306 RepID=UPI003BB58DBF
MSMIEWIRNEERPNLILFVHGLKGGQETWSFNENTSFPSLLNNEEKLKEKFDIACFNYFTTFTNTYGTSKSLLTRIFSSIKKIRKNLPIDELAELLRTEFSVNLTDYKKIILIAHSMGGLVSKACILKQLNETQQSPVKGFISLAVPHSGAKIANIGSLISSNVQLNDLSVLSDAVDQLNRDWLKAVNPPLTKYIYAAYDLYVDKKSALAIDSTKKDSIAVDEDHSSICKPIDKNQTVYKAVLQYIIELESSAAGTLAIADFIDEKQYDDQFFVLKMILADVHEAITGHAKEYFYNAELARKIFTSEHDREQLSQLYKKIKAIYQQEYEHHIAHKTTPDQLISNVHSKIMNEDNEYLKSLLSNLDSVHKKGMLHQIANKNNTAIVWSSATSLEKLIALKGASND